MVNIVRVCFGSIYLKILLGNKYHIKVAKSKCEDLEITAKVVEVTSKEIRDCSTVAETESNEIPKLLKINICVVSLMNFKRKSKTLLRMKLLFLKIQHSITSKIIKF